MKFEVKTDIDTAKLYSTIADAFKGHNITIKPKRVRTGLFKHEDIYRVEIDGDGTI